MTVMRPGGFATHDMARAFDREPTNPQAEAIRVRVERDRVIELSRYHDPARGPFEPVCDRGQQRFINERPGPNATEDELTGYDTDRYGAEMLSDMGVHPLTHALAERERLHKQTFSRDSRYERGGFNNPGSLNRKRTSKQLGSSS